MVGLHHVEGLVLGVQGVLDGLEPLVAGDVAAQGHAAGPPGGLMEAARFDDQVAFALGSLGELGPLADRSAVDAGRVKHGGRRELRLLHDPSLRHDAEQGLMVIFRQVLFPELGELRMVEQGETELLLLEGLHRRRQRQRAGFDRVEDAVGSLDVGEVEEFEETVEDVDAARGAIDGDVGAVTHLHDLRRLDDVHVMAEGA